MHTVCVMILHPWSIKKVFFFPLLSQKNQNYEAGCNRGHQASRSSLLRRGQGSSARSLSMSICHVLLGQFCARRITIGARGSLVLDTYRNSLLYSEKGRSLLDAPPVALHIPPWPACVSLLTYPHLSFFCPPIPICILSPLSAAFSLLSVISKTWLTNLVYTKKSYFS